MNKRKKKRRRKEGGEEEGREEKLFIPGTQNPPPKLTQSSLRVGTIARTILFSCFRIPKREFVAENLNSVA